MLLAAPWRQSAPERAASANTLPRLELGSQVRPGVRVVSGPEAVLAGLIRDMRLEPRRARQRRAVREIRSQAEMIYGGAPTERVFMTPTPGTHTLLCMDDEGRSSEVNITIR